VALKQYTPHKSISHSSNNHSLSLSPSKSVISILLQNAIQFEAIFIF
jgi:hypothetical protein